jgi:ribose transport system substrate-binding protein
VHRRAILVCAFALALPTVACDRRPDSRSAASDGPAEDSSKPTTHSREGFRVGVLYWSATIEGQVVMREGLERELAKINAAEEIDVELITRVAGDGVEGQHRQIEQMRELLAMDLDALIVQPTDNAALTAPLREANALGVPVIAYDQYIEGGRLAAFITSDNRQAGQLDGEYVASRFEDEHTIRIVLVEYPQVSSTVERVDGFFDALRERDQPFTIIGTYQAVEPVGGRRAGAAILEDFPKPGSIDVVFTVNDGGGLAVVDVLAEAGRDEIEVATVDGDPRSVENVRAGRLTIIDSAQFCGPLGALTMRTTYELLQGATVPRQQLVPVFPITRETLDAYPGWAGPIAAPFDKPWPSATPRWTPVPRSPSP